MCEQPPALHEAADWPISIADHVWTPDPDAAIGECLYCQSPHDQQPLPDEDDDQTVCPKHGPTRQAGCVAYVGYAGGRCYAALLECGCSDVDESADVRAAE
jgi:hypothetical protein